LLYVGYAGEVSSPNEKRRITLPATVMVNGPIRLFAVKLEMFSAKASMPFIVNAHIFLRDHKASSECVSRCSSPEVHAYAMHCANARGDMCINKSRGCNVNESLYDPKVLENHEFSIREVFGGDCNTFVKTVLAAARVVPKIVSRHPKGVK
jgi:hypothetical protein